MGTNDPNKGGVRKKVATRVKHEEYHEIDDPHDIGVLKLTEPIEFDENTQPISLPNINPMFDVSFYESGKFTFVELGAKVSYIIQTRRNCILYTYAVVIYLWRGKKVKIIILFRTQV